MLNCILSMVEKTRRALGILQQRANDNHHQQKRRESPSSLQQHQVYEASELRRQAGELIAQTLKATEDRVSQVKRKAGPFCFINQLVNSLTNSSTLYRGSRS